MGTIYSIACKTCKVTRDLDKFYVACKIIDRAEALKYGKELSGSKGWAFRAGLMVSFMAEHMGHECVFFNEHSDCEEELDPYENKHGYVKDTDYWR